MPKDSQPESLPPTPAPALPPPAPAGLRRRALASAARLLPTTVARLLARRYLTPTGGFASPATQQESGFATVAIGRQTVLRFAPPAGTPQGPRLLIVPGHDGDLRQFLRLQRHLGRGGATVDVLVLPGHLGPDPALCSLGDIVGALKEIAARHGPYDGLIAHCVGCSASLLALRDTALARRLVFVSASLRLAALVRFGGQQYGLRGRCLSQFVAEVSRLGAPYPLDAPWRPVALPLLVVHARNDYAVPVSDVANIETLWPGARLRLFDQGDHNSLLGLRRPIVEIADFLQRPA